MAVLSMLGDHHDVFGQFDEALLQVKAHARHIQELDAAKSNFFYNISHELRAPLSLVIGPLQSLLDGRHGALSDQAAEQILVSLRNSQRLLRLVNQVLDLSKMDDGSFRLDREMEDLATIVDEAVYAFSPLAARLDITLSGTSSGDPCFVPVDRDSIEKILANLLSNALKFTMADGSIKVGVRKTHSHAEITVQDTGIGIPADKVPYIFDRYFQAHDSATHVHGGSGIGLSLVKQLVALHDGSIDVQTISGDGATFTVLLPLELPAHGSAVLPPVSDRAVSRKRSANVPDSYTDIATRTSGAPGISSSERVEYDGAAHQDRTTVLVVEDQPDMCLLIRRILAPSYRVVEAKNGVAAMERISELLPDAIITDVMMPDMDGLELCRQLRADAMTADIPLIFLSAKAQAQFQLEGMLAGADAYVTKPFEAELLWALVGNLIAKRHRLRALPVQMPLRREEPSERPESLFMVQVRGIIDAHLVDPEFSVEQLAAETAMSPSGLYRRLREEIGAAPNDLIRTIRLERAARLLADHRGTVSEVAYAVGFNSLSYFGRCFRAHFGVAASTYAISRRLTASQA